MPEVAVQAAVEADGTRAGRRSPGWLVGGGIRWSLSLGGAEVANVRAAAAAASRAAADLENTRSSVHLDVVSALRRLEAARARQNAGRAAVDQAREAERIVGDRFEAGLAAVADVLRASSAVVDAEAERVAAAVDGLVACAMLRRALGRIP